MKKAYLQLLEITSRVTGQAKKFSGEIARRVKRGNLSVMRKANQTYLKFPDQPRSAMRRVG